MSLARHAAEQLTTAREYFDRSTGNLTEALSGLAPAEGIMTAVQSLAAARAWFEQAIAIAVATLASQQ